MYTHKKLIALFVCLLAIVIGLTAFALPPRNAIAVGQPGGFVSIPFMNFNNTSSGEQYGLTVIARESDDRAGKGTITVQLLGPGISFCSTHGGGVDIGTSDDGENYSAGNFPLQEIQCGTSYEMVVSVEKCVLKAEMHGYSHSDYPFYTYTGPATIEVALNKSKNGTAQLNMKVFTPRGIIKLGGKLNEPFDMDTCP